MWWWWFEVQCVNTLTSDPLDLCTHLYLHPSVDPHTCHQPFPSFISTPSPHRTPPSSLPTSSQHPYPFLSSIPQPHPLPFPHLCFPAHTLYPFITFTPQPTPLPLPHLSPTPSSPQSRRLVYSNNTKTLTLPPT